MIIACPKCETSFSMPDELYRPGKKARCSQCGNVFAMPALQATEEIPDPLSDMGEVSVPAPQPAKSKRKLTLNVKPQPRMIILAAAALICFLGIGYGGYITYRSFTSPAANTAGAPVADNAAARPGAEEVKAMTEAERKQAEHEKKVGVIALEDVRQFLYDNDKLGRIVVIQGYAVNTADTPKDFIIVEGQLFDANQKPLVSVQQICGASLTLFQLQVLSEKELRDVLDNRITVLTNNTNIPKDGRVPFVIIFPRLPEAMRSFGVRIIEVRDSAPQQ